MNANLQKYLKYKAKYLDLKNELEGGKLNQQVIDEIKNLQKKISSLTDASALNLQKIQIKEKIKNEIIDKIENQQIEIDQLENNIRNTRGRGKGLIIKDLNTQITGHEEKIQNFNFQVKKIDDEIDTKNIDNIKIKQEITRLKDELEYKKENVGDNSTKKTLFDMLKNRTHKPKDIFEKEYEETSKSKVQDNNTLLIKIKQNMDTIYNTNYQENDDNSNYLLRIFDLTSEFVSKLTRAMDTQNHEVYKESMEKYSDSEEEQNKIGNGLESLNKIMGDLSRLRDSNKTKEYNDLLNKYSSIKEITNEYSSIKEITNEYKRL
jgi:protein-tyrosine phosphatase